MQRRLGIYVYARPMHGMPNEKETEMLIELYSDRGVGVSMLGSMLNRCCMRSC